jgi:predicted DsbA family dithiol-disulfide isomerase
VLEHGLSAIGLTTFTEQIMKVLTILMYVSVVVAAMAVAWSAIVGPRASGPAPQGASVNEEYWRGWEELRELGPAKGSPEAPVVILEFVDYQCAFCQRLAPVLDSLVTAYPSALRVVSLPFPLPQHRFAEATAIAAECASWQDQFPAMYSTLFAVKDSIGLLGWDSVADRAGIIDLQGFEGCLASELSAEAVKGAAEIGRQLGVSGTPTIVLNGRRIRSALDYSSLRRSIELTLAGESPAPPDTVEVLERVGSLGTIRH